MNNNICPCATNPCTCPEHTAKPTYQNLKNLCMKCYATVQKYGSFCKRCVNEAEEIIRNPDNKICACEKGKQICLLHYAESIKRYQHWLKNGTREPSDIIDFKPKDLKDAMKIINKASDNVEEEITMRSSLDCCSKKQIKRNKKKYRTCDVCNNTGWLVPKPSMGTLSDKRVGLDEFYVYPADDVKQFIKNQNENYVDLMADILALLLIHKITNVEFMRQLRELLKIQKEEIINKPAGKRLT